MEGFRVFFGALGHTLANGYYNYKGYCTGQDTTRMVLSGLRDCGVWGLHDAATVFKRLKGLGFQVFGIVEFTVEA